ncbi:MAG TPA: chromate efflux transporter [Thermodesulfobacteriota bacterium]|nr:chromate efflux transporter [Thermodesulfobacteriota bacterium]
MSELALFFLRLGTTAFGGPAAHIAMMEDEVVQRRQWVTREKFLDLLGAANLIPGPSSTEMAIFIGYLCKGWPGLLLGGVCFIAPATVIVIVLAWAYMCFGNLPQVTWVLYGVKPVVIAIILQALWQLGRTAVKNKFLGVLAMIGLVLNFLGINILVLLFGTGVISGMQQGLIQDRARNWKPLMIMLLSVCCFLAVAYFATGLYSTEKVTFGLLPLFLFFVKIGSVIFGSGYVLLAFLQADLVGHWHWLTTTQLLDAIAVGQVTPGPVFTTATFIGYLLARLPGALIATAGIFLPSFIFVAASSPLIPRLRKSTVAGAFLDGVIIASLALMASVTYSLGRDAVIDLPTALLVLGSAILLVRFRLNSLWLVLGGALIGLLVYTARMWLM